MDRDELAAVAIALRLLRAQGETAQSARSAWDLATHYPDLGVDELRAFARTGYDVP